jgi:hypothetical protein
LKGKVLDMNKTDAFISLEDGTTIDLSVSRLSQNVKVGDTIDVPISIRNSIDNSSFSHDKATSDKLIDFF